MPTKKKTKDSAATEPAVVTPEVAQAPKRLTRSSTDVIVCGVCAGIAEYLAIDPIIIRLLFVILAISGGSGLLIYIVLCVILPDKKSVGKSTKEVMEENTKDLGKTIEDVAANVEAAASKKNTQTWIGLIVIIVGASLMANNFGIFAFGDAVRIFVRTLWPLAIIAVGLVILSRNNHGK